MTHDPGFSSALRWLQQHAQFPQRRLDRQAELLVLFAAAAGSGDSGRGVRFLGETRDPAQTSAMRAHGLRRSLVHFKCDNSAKV